MTLPTAADIAEEQQLVRLVEIWARGEHVSEIGRRFCARKVKAICLQRQQEFERRYAARAGARDRAFLTLYVVRFSGLAYADAGREIVSNAARYKRLHFAEDAKRRGAPGGDQERQLYFDICRAGRIPKSGTIAKIVAREHQKQRKAAA